MRTTLEPLFGAALTEGSADILADAARADLQGVLARIDAERIAPLLRAQLHRSGEIAICPPELQRHLTRRAHEASGMEILRFRELRRLHDAFAAERIKPLLLKGAGLAYTCYPDPSQRPREDVDLLVRADDAPALGRAIETLGYQRALETSGELLTHQIHYERQEAGYRHVCDVHTKPFNPLLFANVLSYDDVAPSAVPVPPLGPTACTPGAVDALLLACVHRIAHHDTTDELIWLYDIALLCARIDAAGLDALVALALSRRVALATAAALERALVQLDAPVPRLVIEQLRQRAVEEPSARFLAANLSPFDVLLSDMATLSGWRPRLQLLREHLFPPRPYIRAKYGVKTVAGLSLAYARRIACGAPRWLRDL